MGKAVIRAMTADDMGAAFAVRTSVIEQRWLQSEGSGPVWLTTAPDTRAAAFYARRGFMVSGREPDGSLRLELRSWA